MAGKEKQEEMRLNAPSCFVHHCALASGLCILSDRLFHHHLACAAVGVAHDDETALLAADSSAVQVVIACHSGYILTHLSVFYSIVEGDNLIGIPWLFYLITFLGFFVCHINSL